MTRTEYTELRQQLAREHGENSPLVARIDERRSQELAMSKRGGERIVDASNQANQGPPARPVNGGYSDEDYREAAWYEKRLAEAEGEGKYLARKEHFEGKG